MRPLDLSALNLVRRKSSSLLAVVALGCAIGLSGFLLTLQGALLETLARREQGIEFLVGPKSSSLRLLMEGLFLTGRESEIVDYRLIKTLSDEIQPEWLVPFALFARERGVPVIGIEDSFLDFIKRDDPRKRRAVVRGRWFNLNTPEPEAVLGAEAAEILGLGPDDWIQPRSEVRGPDGQPVWSKKTRIVGVLRPSGQAHDRAIFVPISEAWDAHLRGHDMGVIHPSKRIRGVSWFALVLGPGSGGRREHLVDIVRNRSVGQLVDVEQEYSTLLGILGQGRNLTEGLILLSLFLSCSVVALLLVERFEAMRPELGLYRALGYTRHEIARTLLWEGVLLGILGISLGMVLERFAVYGLTRVWYPLWFTIPAWPAPPLLFLWGGTLFAILLIPWVPIIRLYRWAPHETLSAF